MIENVFSPVWPHGEIKEVFPDIFYVMGTNVTEFNNVTLQHSRNMIIVRDKEKLSLINTVRLNEAGLAALDSLGKVENVIRIGAFHGRDDAFYLDRYSAKLWALPKMEHQNHRQADVLLAPHQAMPFNACSVFVFETSVFPEGILHLAKEGGILITCDSIKNWETADPYFSQSTADLYKQEGYFGTATISNVWLNACKVKASDFDRLQSLQFNHLISAHGIPLLNTAHTALTQTLKYLSFPAAPGGESSAFNPP